MFKSLSETVMQGVCPYCKKDSFVYTYENEKVFLCHHCQRHLSYEKVIKNANNDNNDSGVSRSDNKINITMIVSYTVIRAYLIFLVTMSAYVTSGLETSLLAFILIFTIVITFQKLLRMPKLNFYLQND